MSTKTSGQAASYTADVATDGSPVSRPLLPLVVLLFIGSGCAALIYEVVWFQLLSLIVGSSAVSMAVVLGTFMGGMCLGSLKLQKYMKADQHPLAVYAKLELAIGVMALLILFLMPLTGKAYIAIGGGGPVGIVMRAIFCVLWLLPPTVMMGATLPAIARWVETTPKGVSWMGFFYGGNIAGAVVGGLAAGFYLLPKHDMHYATFVAVAINAIVGFAALALSKQTSFTPIEEKVDAYKSVLTADNKPIYLAIALSGMTALAAEGIWTRLVTLLVGGTTYTFSIILGVVLIGLGVGSTVASAFAPSLKNPRRALAICQLGLVATIGWAAWLLMAQMPYWPINPGLSSQPWFTFQVDFWRAFVALFPSALLWGASFPLTLASVAEPGQDPAKLIGSVYAANTVGAIVGALLGSVALVPLMGTQNAQRVLIAVAAVSAIIVFLKAWKPGAQAGYLMAGVTMAAAGIAIAITPKLPELLVAYGRYSASRFWDHGEFIFMDEGMNSSMAVSRLSNGVLNYHNAGKVQASSEPQDMRLQRMLGHLTTLLPPQNAKSVLVIGCGAGVTAGATSIDPDVSKVTIAEIERLVPKFVARNFGDHNYHVVDNPKTTVKWDDGRHFLLTTNEKFDAITSDPFDPWVKGAATLYTAEFFKAAREKLNDGGVVTVFVQLYESGTAAVKSEIAGFMAAFPNGIVFGNTYNGQGYDVVLVGQKKDGPIDVDAVQARLDDPRYAQVRQSLSEIGMNSAIDLFSTFASRGPMLQPWLADAVVNTDDNLRLQFLAGAGLNAYEQAEIYRGILATRQWPADLFTGKPETIQALQQAMLARY